MRYKCTICNKEKRTTATLISHINRHYEMSKRERNKQIDKLKQELLPINKSKTEIQKLKKSVTNPELNKFKDQIIPILIEYNVPQKILNKISNGRNLIKIKRLITGNVSNEVKSFLTKNGINFYVSPKIKVKAKKVIESKDYFDATTSSIIAISTPMGNKR